MHHPKLLLALLATLVMTSVIPHASALSSTMDTDGDGLTDAIEDGNGTNAMEEGETNPFDADSDGGGESDGSEVSGKRNPLDPMDDLTYDADGDGWVNGIELSEKTDPNNQDTDNDGVVDPSDSFPLDSKYQVDTNSNKLPDEWEEATGLSASMATPTTVEDPDGDGLTNAEELARGTNPLSTDTDRDGVDDKTELDQTSDPKENACLSFGPATTDFSDMKDHWAEKIVSRLSRTLILPNSTPVIRGYAVAEGKPSPFNPDQQITRYEFLKMVMLTTCSKIRASSSDAKATFSDVRKDMPINENADAAFKRQIIYSASHYGFVTGYEDGTFRPDAPVNRAEALKILSIASSLQTLETQNPVAFFDVTENDWFSTYVTAAASREIVRGYEDGTFRPGNPITRAEAAKIVYFTMLGNPTINGYVLPTEEE